MKACLLFDWTGTLVNEFKVDKNICNKMEHEISKKEKITRKKAKKKYKALLQKFENSWEWYDYTLHSKIFGIDWKSVQMSELSNLRLIPDALKVLTHYKELDYQIFLLTNAVEPILNLRIKYLEMDKYFDLIITSDIVKSEKSTGKHIEKALKFINVPKSNVFMIGDNIEQDIIPAKKLGIRCILCKFGKATYSHTKNKNKESHLYDPDYIISNLKDLFNII